MQRRRPGKQPKCEFLYFLCDRVFAYTFQDQTKKATCTFSDSPYKDKTEKNFPFFRSSLTTRKGVNRHFQAKVGYYNSHTFKTTGWPKMAQFLYALTSSNIDRFSKLVHCQNRRKFAIIPSLIPSLKIPPHLKCVATPPCEMSLSGANCCSISLIFEYICSSDGDYIVYMVAKS